MFIGVPVIWAMLNAIYPVYAGKHRGNFRGSNHCYEWRKSLNIDDFVRFKLLKIGRKSGVESGMNAALTVASS